MDDLTSLATHPGATRWVGRPTIVRERTGSTNDDARAAARAGVPAGYVVVADAQDAGRGRRGRAWHSPPGESLYVSLVVRPADAPGAAAVIALAAGLAVSDAVRAVLAPERRVTVKWPNDVRVDGRKVAGVLVEGSVRGGRLEFAVVGVGLNVAGRALPPELAATATTLWLAGARPAARVDVARRLFVALEARLDALARAGPLGTIAAVAARCDTLGARVRVGDAVGVAEAIAPDGALALRADDGRLVLVHAGEPDAVG